MATQHTVLLVEDEVSVREALADLLRFHHYQVLTAASVAEAEATLQQVGIAAIELVISDIHLTPDPQAHAGYTLYQRWHAQFPALPFLLISGDPTNQNLPDIRAGLVRLLLKPLLPDVFLAAVRDALGG